MAVTDCNEGQGISKVMLSSRDSEVYFLKFLFETLLIGVVVRNSLLLPYLPFAKFRRGIPQHGSPI